MSSPAYQLEIELSAAKQDRLSDGWCSKAQDYLSHYRASKPQNFTIEDFRDYAEPLGLDEPANGSAYGKVMQTASKRKQIEMVGFSQATRAAAHSRPLRVWRAA